LFAYNNISQFFFEEANFPNGFLGNGKQAEFARDTFIECRGASAKAIRMSPLRIGNQLVIPESENPKFFAECFDVNLSKFELKLSPGQTQPAVRLLHLILTMSFSSLDGRT
jgi:hypothetical protein